MPPARKALLPAPDPVLALSILGLTLILVSGAFLLALESSRPGREDGLWASGSNLGTRVLETESDLYHYLTTAGETHLAAHRRALEEAERLMNELVRVDASLGLTDSLLAASVGDLRQKLNAWRTDYARPAAEAKRKKESGRLSGLTRRGVGPERFGPVREAIGKVREHVAQTVALGEARSARRKTAGMAGAITGAVMLLCGVIALLKRQRSTAAITGEKSRSLQRLAEYSERIHHANSPGQAARQLAMALSDAGCDALVLLNTGEKAGMAVAASGSSLSEAKELLLLLEDREICPVLRTGQPLHVPSAAREHVCSCPLKTPDSAGHFCFPLLVRARVAGVAGLRFPAASPPPPEKLEEVRALARITSLGVSALTALEDARHQAVTDTLTGAFNRRFLESFLEKQVQTASRQDQSLAILMLDLDRFKAFNDRFGHQAGDELLRACAEAMNECVRNGDLAARFGGEEFTVVLPDADRETAFAIGERIRSRVEKLPAPGRTVGDNEPGPTVSIGLAVSPRDGATAADLIGAADAALYRAKESGRNRVIAAGS